MKVGLRGSTQGSKLLIVLLLACRNEGGMHLYIREVRLHHIPVSQIFFPPRRNPIRTDQRADQCTDKSKFLVDYFKNKPEGLS